MKSKPVRILFLALLVGVCSPQFLTAQPNWRIAAAQGLARVGGEDLLVTVLVAVGPGEDARAKSRGALEAAHPGARELDHDLFTVTGLDWNSSSSYSPVSGIPVRYNPSGEPGLAGSSDGVASVRDTINDALARWDEVPTSYFKFGDGGLTSDAPSLVKESPGAQFRDGNNDVAWGDIKGRGTLGVTWSTTSGEPEFDMMLDNRNFNWFIATDESGVAPASNQIDLWSVVVHELGHALGLGHTEDSDNIMQAHYDDGFIRQLGADDIAGVSCLYPEDGYVCGEDTGGGDVEAPVISNVRTTNPKRNGQFSIRWDTDEPSTTVVHFISPSDATSSNGSLVESHQLNFRGGRGVLYQFEVFSTDAAGNTAGAGPFNHQN